MKHANYKLKDLINFSLQDYIVCLYPMKCFCKSLTKFVSFININ